MPGGLAIDVAPELSEDRQGCISGEMMYRGQR